MDKPQVYESLIAKGVLFFIERNRLCYRSQKVDLSDEELGWIERNRSLIALDILQQQLLTKRYLYAECLGFERKPFYRPLTADCIAAGRCHSKAFS